MIEGFEFLHPYFLLLPLLFILCAKFCKANKEALFFPHLHIFEQLLKRRIKLLFLLKWSAIIFGSIALSSPVYINSYHKSKSYGIDIALILDASGSMQEVGFDAKNTQKSKFVIAQEVASEFIDKRVNDNLALVVFGEYAVIVSPLTFDKKLLKEILMRLKVGIAGEKTAIHDAVMQAIRALKNSKASSKVIVLLTDGINNAGEIPKHVVLSALKDYQIKLYSIGFGLPQEIDVRLLREYAKSSGGDYFHADSKESLQLIYKMIDELEKSQIESLTIPKMEYLFIYPLFIAIMSLLFYVYLKSRSSF